MRKKEIYFILIRHVLLLLFFIFAVLSFSANAGPNNPTNLTVKTTRLKNIARAKTCIFEQTPNYQHCTDMSDARQLTDGVYSKGYFWVQRSTVGWHRTDPVTFIIDLKAIMPISGVMFNTAAGVAGVRWPWAILIFVSNDLDQYQYVGNLIDLDKSGSLPKLGKYSTHRFWTDNISASGRYVKFVVVPNGQYTFVDEIAVYKGDSTVDSSAENLLQNEYEASTDLDSFVAKCRIQAGVKRRLTYDVEAVATALDEIGNPKLLKRNLIDIKTQINSLKEVEIDGFSTEFPINDLHQKIFDLQAAVWRKKGLDALILWQKHRWDMVSPSEMPTEKTPSIDLKMMRNEYRNAAFNITNTGETQVSLNLTIEGLPGGRDPDYIKVHGGIWTDTAEGVPVMAALPLLEHADDSYVLEIYPGLTRQVWLSINSKDLKPGTYTGQIKVQQMNSSVPIKIKVYPIEFPEEPRFHVGGWDYTHESNHFDVTGKNRVKLATILQEYYVDTPWASASVFDKGKYDSQGNSVKAPNSSKFEKWVDLWPKAKNYSIYLSVKNKFAGFEIGTKQFEKAVTQWINFWVNKAKDNNISPGKIMLLLVDEPGDIEKSQRAIEYAKIIRKAQPKLIIFEDVVWEEPWNAPEQLFEYSDILSPNLEKWLNSSEKFSEFYHQKKSENHSLWFYSAIGSSKLKDPYGYYCWPLWFSWNNGVEGMNWWAFGDSGGSPSENEYLAEKGGPYTPLFIKEDDIAIGKQMEAIREGVEDFEYLAMLKDRIDQMTSRGKNDEAEKAKKILEQSVNRVVSSMQEKNRITWTVDKDRAVADEMREKVLDTINSLN